MLSGKLIMQEKIAEICRRDKTRLAAGMTFDKIMVSEPGFYSAMLCGTVTFLGQTDSGEMLFCSGNGRYYFTLRGGWGVEGNCLYALSIGAIRRDFKKPVTIEEIEFGVNNPQEPKGIYSALAGAMRREADKAILTVLRPVERGG